MGEIMTVQIKVGGNSQGIRLSKELLTLAGIKNNDILEVELQNGNIVLKKVKRGHRTLEEREEKYGGKLGTYEKFDWGEPVGRENW